MSFHRYRIRKALNRVTGQRLIDDLYWADYNDHYRSELRENEKHHTLQLSPGDLETSQRSAKPLVDSIERLVYAQRSAWPERF